VQGALAGLLILLAGVCLLRLQRRTGAEAPA
jgi:hypothetical protein